MIDIIDVILGKSLSSSGRLEYYAAKAQKAAQDAATAVDNIDSITEQTNTNNTAAAEALEQANQALENVTEALNNLDEGTVTEEDVRDEIDNLLFSLTTNVNNTTIYKNLVISYPSDEQEVLNNLIIMYQQEGQNTNGTMTQKAITDYVAGVETALNQRINSIPSGGGSGGTSNLGTDNAGHIVVVGPYGNIISGSTTEEEIIAALVKSGSYIAKNAVGLQIDYSNRSFARTQEAVNYSLGSDFDKYDMYGGRMRCNVADNGTINAFYGDSQYRDDGSNGQVMIYQPKFYYQRIPIELADNVIGKKIRKESIIISAIPQAGFKVHPLFIGKNGGELDYVLLPAYEGCVYDTSANEYNTTDKSGVNFSEDKLASISGAKPISGKNNALTLNNAEQLANNRGAGWHITNLAAESALQMLASIEFGTLNGQTALDLGVCNITTTGSTNGASLTGSTAALGNTSGYANSTINENAGTTTTYTTSGKRAISYRGMENPWGNIWRLINGIKIIGNGSQLGGIPYICYNYEYSDANKYENSGIILPTNSDYASAFGYGNTKYDWAFFPVECNNANSAVPIGDFSWSAGTLNATNLVLCGGHWGFGAHDGLFSFAFDNGIDSYGRSFNARIMFIPTEDNIYISNINKWRAKRGY